MNSRRSRSVKLVSAARANNRALEVDITEEGGEEETRMSSSAANTVYCCIAKGRSVIYSSNSNNHSDPQVEATAALCLEISPPHHRHYVHTSGCRSYGYLMADGHTFFAIIDPSVGSAGALQFLERVRDAFRSSSRSNGFQHESLVPAVQRLVASLEKMPHAAFVLDDDGGGTGDCGNGCTTPPPSSSSSKVPLLGKSGSRKEKRRSRDKLAAMAGGGSEDERHGTTRAVRIDVPNEDVGGLSLECSTSQSRLRRQLQQQPSRSLWMRHVKIIIIIDAVVCLVLFVAWLAVCKGFQCVSG